MDPKKKEFIELFQRSGWSQAEAARRLEMTRGGINGIITGATVPTEMTLKLMRMLLVTEQPEAVFNAANNALEPWEEKLLRALRALNNSDRNQILNVVRTLLDGFSRRDVATALDGSGALSEIAQRGGEAAAIEAVKESAGSADQAASYQKKHKAALTNGKTSSPKKGVPVH